MSEVEFKSVWRMPDEQVTQDAMDLWRSLKALPDEISIEDRAAQLLYAGYIDGELACVATAEVLPHNQVRRNFAFTRYLTVPKFREHDLFTQGARFGHEWLAAWAQENPEADISGTLWTWNPQQGFYGRPAAPY